MIEFVRAGWPGEIAAALDALARPRPISPRPRRPRRRCGRAFEKSVEASWFEPRPGRLVLREFDVCDAGGDTYRMDRVVVDPESVLVVDFKTGSRPQFAGEYREQIRRYRGLMKRSLPRPARSRRPGLPRPGPDRGGRMSPARVRLVSPRESLIAAVAERLPREGRDFSRSWVVFPERRPAYYLRKHWPNGSARVLSRRGFIPLDAFVDHVYAERLGRRSGRSTSSTPSRFCWISSAAPPTASAAITSSRPITSSPSGSSSTTTLRN